MEPNEPEVAKLAGLLRAHAPYDGRFALRIGGLYAIRASRATTELLHTTYDPMVCIVAQGAKRMWWRLFGGIGGQPVLGLPGEQLWP